MNDIKIHEVHEYLSGEEIRWHDFREVGVEEDYYDWYYAEDRLYIIRDRVMTTYYFVEARSPVDAMKKYREHREDIARAMGGVDHE